LAANVVVDSSFLVALLNGRDRDHEWAAATTDRFPPPWSVCEAILAEAFYLLGEGGHPALAAILSRGALVPAFAVGEHLSRVLGLMDKYADVPMSFADACLVRMTETLPDPVVLTLDADFGVYRRHGRQVVPFVSPEHPNP
jgi:uncharacterized protein